MKPVSDLFGKTFERLTVLERAPKPETRKNSTDAYWKCQCICGKTTVVRSYALTTGHTTSCGCLKAEAPHLALLPNAQPKYTPEIAAAHVVWHRRNRYSELPFDEFYRLSQLPCHYCGSKPSLINKCKQNNNTGIFTYNTIDRIDSSKGHIIGNVVPACLICNRAKLNSPIQDFYDRINRLINNLCRPQPKEYRDGLFGSVFVDMSNIHYAELTSIKVTYKDYHNGILTLEQFYRLTTTDCYYCGAIPSNKRNTSSWLSSAEAKINSTFIYNGLDRIDNNLPHDYENVVPCCKYCNTAKGQLSLQQFNDWIIRLANHRSNRLPAQ